VAISATAGATHCGSKHGPCVAFGNPWAAERLAGFAKTLQAFDDVYNPDLIYHNITPTVHAMHTFEGDDSHGWTVHYRANQTTLPTTPIDGALVVHQARGHVLGRLR
jgi:hypothetical protein